MCTVGYKVFLHFVAAEMKFYPWLEITYEIRPLFHFW
jgi:hypothetical protein